MADRLKHLSNLLILSLMKYDFIPGIVGGSEWRDLARRKPFVIVENASPEPVEVTFERTAGQFGVVDLRHNAGLRHPLGELAVIRQNDQPFGSEIESPDRIDALFDAILHIFEDRGPAFRIARSGHHVLGLVQKDINMTGAEMDLFPVDLDDVEFAVRFAAELGDFVSVHRDAPLLDQLFSLPARSDARMSKD